MTTATPLAQVTLGGGPEVLLMKTVKIIGSGPFAGLSWYGTITGIGDGGRVHMQLDESVLFRFSHDDLVVDEASGAARVVVLFGAHTDMLHVAEEDMPRFCEIVAAWRDAREAMLKIGGVHWLHSVEQMDHFTKWFASHGGSADEINALFAVRRLDATMGADELADDGMRVGEYARIVLARAQRLTKDAL